ncbi:hypothetical protein COLU111180_11905 [Cohnella lubricantis]|uniref:Uncharacterized protein n=1 Tax=Cohnella lubricantis TaxID=2163172 RepID=A0A841T331_9BACL|nr:hypothetical protein [Cohnella lubricantis]MBB6675993.1 hypothetical protein [Cohnella lubricantis]MBP2117887.1 hypothetical protein [Cohnella lubricantis]
MRTWEMVNERLKQHLTSNGITFEVTGDVIHTDLCTIEISGYPNKPEYWVNEVRISRLDGVSEAVQSCISPMSSEV